MASAPRREFTTLMSSDSESEVDYYGDNAEEEALAALAVAEKETKTRKFEPYIRH